MVKNLLGYLSSIELQQTWDSNAIEALHLNSELAAHGPAVLPQPKQHVQPRWELDVGFFSP